jgi:signal transduction histidine kinase
VKTESTPLRSPTEIRAARFDLVSRLADDLAHEIKNPLHSMVINLEVMRRRVANGATEQALERADVLAHELDRLNRLVEQMLLLLRPERDGARVLGVADLLHELSPLLELRAGVARKRLSVQLAGPDVAVRARTDLLRLALLAAADWAISVVPAGGNVAIGFTTRHGRVEITVDAHGAPALSLPGSGAGAALATARAFLHELGGDADATDGTDGGYLRFTLIIPCAADA